MRAAFLGKGGSGKTTLAAALIKHISKKRKIIAIDADLNVNLGKNLGITAIPNPIGENFSMIAQYLKGKRTDINTFVATTPPSLNSNFIKPVENDSFFKKYSVTYGNITLVNVGTYVEKDIGHTCYHGKLNVLEMVYHHLLDGESDIVIADATAGADNLGVSLYFCYDTNFMVVEPTIKSIGVFMDYQKKAREFGIQIMAVANKIREPADLTFIKSHIPDIIAVFPKCRDIVQFEQGNASAFDEFIDENSSQLDILFEHIITARKDWKAYYNLLLRTHIQNSVEFWDNYYKEKISEQKDPYFSYEKAIELIKK